MKFAAESGPTHDCGEAVLFLSYRRSTLLAEVSWILEMLSRDSTHFSELRRNPSNCVEYK